MINGNAKTKRREKAEQSARGYRRQADSPHSRVRQHGSQLAYAMVCALDPSTLENLMHWVARATALAWMLLDEERRNADRSRLALRQAGPQSEPGSVQPEKKGKQISRA